MGRRPYNYDMGSVKTTKIAGADMDDVKKAITELLEYRDHTLTIPEGRWPDEKLYASLIPTDVQQALLTLNQYPEWVRGLNTDRRPLVYFMRVDREKVTRTLLKERSFPDEYHLDFEYILQLPEALPCPRANWTDALMMFSDHPQYPLFYDYITQVMRLEDENKAVKETALDVMVRCNTWGQVKRLWPGLFTFLPENFGKVKEVRKQSQLSPLPRDMGNDEVEALIARTEHANRVLTQAVLLKANGRPPARLDMR